MRIEQTHTVCIVCIILLNIYGLLFLFPFLFSFLICFCFLTAQRLAKTNSFFRPQSSLFDRHPKVSPPLCVVCVVVSSPVRRSSAQWCERDSTSPNSKHPGLSQIATGTQYATHTTVRHHQRTTHTYNTRTNLASVCKYTPCACTQRWHSRVSPRVTLLQVGSTHTHPLHRHRHCHCRARCQETNPLLGDTNSHTVVSPSYLAPVDSTTQ